MSRSTIHRTAIRGHFPMVRVGPLLARFTPLDGSSMHERVSKEMSYKDYQAAQNGVGGAVSGNVSSSFNPEESCSGSLQGGRQAYTDAGQGR